MTYTILLSQKNTTSIARVKEWPEVVVEDPSRDEAIQRITSELHDSLTPQVDIVPVEIPLPRLHTPGA